MKLGHRGQNNTPTRKSSYNQNDLDNEMINESGVSNRIEKTRRETEMARTRGVRYK